MKFIKKSLILMVVIGILIVVGLDLGNLRGQSSGAGDIWWTEVPEISESYQRLNK
ncbi:hypothetical protein [Fuchsiella alkaliacetigena]|uniref:hypothetical protein n=1 Tax=Fuchsiella alkaliacetigena TaxID=957042 RepID=UPI00200A2562|nr:hypothetical protein [Fuchsiella alkaliacetigena]MCK8824414.1 hypothetical protein [Fuchsiella alkaliacetigena]